MKAERGRELESGQDQNLFGQFAVLAQQLALAPGYPVKLLQVGEILNLVLEPDPTSDRVMIREGDDIEPLIPRRPEQVDGADVWFLVIN